MGKFNETVGNFPEIGGEREYAKEIKITSGISNVFRLPDGEDSFIEYTISWIMCDDNVIRPFIIENEHEGISILGRMFGDRKSFYTGGYFETKKTKYGAVPTYQAIDPELYTLMTEYWNEAYKGKGSAKPKTEWIYNAIQRTPEIIENQNVYWCLVNKHTKVVRFGQKAMLALSAVMDNDGHKIEEYDINYTKQGSGAKTVHSMMKAGPGIAHAIPGLLSLEETNYTRYPLDEITRIATAYYCLKHIPIKIQRMDRAMGTNFFAEFEKQAAIEQEMWEKNKINKTVTNNTPPTNYQTVAPEKVFDDSSIPFTGNAQPSRIAAQTATVATPIVTPPVSGRRLVIPSTPVIPANTILIPCPTCGQQIPEDSVTCPKCGDKLLEPCLQCNNLFSTKLNICPHCGAIYE